MPSIYLVLPQSVSDEFMSDAIKLLKQVHTSTSTKKSGSAVLSCHDSWGDISELWGLGIQGEHHSSVHVYSLIFSKYKNIEIK